MKIKKYIFPVIIVLLCMITIYQQRRIYTLDIVYNRSDRELAMLNKDYEKLYSSYYAYDKKLMLMVPFLQNIHWSADSCFYIFGNEKLGIAGVHHKQSLKEESYLWLRNKITDDKIYLVGRADTLKPHQWITMPQMPVEGMLFISGKKNELPAGDIKDTLLLP